MRLLNLFRRRQLDAEMSAEMQAHVELQTERNRQAGMSARDARDSALRQFGNVASIQQQCREQRSWQWLENWTRDLRLAARSLARTPGFSAAVFLTLALCLGPNTAILSTLYSLVLKPLPFPAPHRLVTIRNISTNAGNVVSNTGIPQYEDFVRETDRFERLALFEAANTTIGEDSVPTRAVGLRVTAGFFDVLGIAPQQGRFFAAEEETSGQGGVLVLSHSFWVKQYQADPAVIGRTVRMGGETFTIVGVAPASLEVLLLKTDFLKPFEHGPEEQVPNRRYASRATLVGRLKSGVTVQEAQTQLAAIEDRFRLERASPAFRAQLDKAGIRIVVAPWGNGLADTVRQPLWMLAGAAFFVLLIGAVNVANLMLARVNVKRPELAIRMALGAGWHALLRQLLCEALLLTGAAVVAGIGIGWATLQWLNHSFAVTARFAPILGIDGRVLALVLGTGAVLALFVGVLPFAWLRRAGLRVSESRTVSAGGGLRLLSASLVVGQVALALILLVGSGLLIRSFANVLAVNPGFNTEQVVQGRIALSRSYDDPKADTAIRQRLVDAMKEIPGVTSVAYSSYFGIGPASSYRTIPFTLRRAQAAAGEPLPVAYLHPVSDGFFATLGTRILEGRDFDETDDGRTGAFGLIVDRTFAERYFPGRSALGEEVALGGGPFPADFRWPRIIAVVERANVVGLEERDGLPFIYRLLGRNHQSSGFNLLVASPRPATEILADMRAKIRGIDPALPFYNASTLREALDLMLYARRAIMALLTIFALLALLLAAVGLYGVLAYDVTQRTKEIGIRAAIGASPRQILALLLRQGLGKVGLGLVIGLSGALFLTRYLRSLLFDVQQVDAPAYVAVGLLLLAVASLACWLPALRAAKVDPMVALRAE